MTIEEKARAYDEAIEKIKYVMEHGVSPVLNKEDLQDIFPELAESEDERIRKELIKHLRDGAEGYMPAGNAKDYTRWLSWLEKQGDTNETIDKDELAQGVLKGAAINLITWIDYNAAEGNMCLSNVQCKEIENALVRGDWNKIYAYMKKKLEKQGEQKPTDNGESKFHEGDWVACEELNSAKIINIVDDKYEVEFIDGNKGFPHIDYLDRNFHLWTIQDAKDGDVLVHNGCTFIFMGIKDGIVQAIEENILEPVSFGKPDEDNDYHPATKEQRDTLFAKMKKAGWEWDTEKKKLKRINVELTDFEKSLKHIMIETLECGDTRNLKADAEMLLRLAQKPIEWSEKDDAYKLFAISAVEDYYDEKNPLQKDLVDWLKSIKNRVQPQLQSAWSEEDEVKINRIVDCLENLNVADNDILLKDVDWLKSLRPQKQWKPSDEQMDALKDALNDAICQYDFKGSPIKEEVTRKHAEIIESLYNDLKKLKG